jgi:uncharacterized C2H2 Zn-finger protein
MIFKGLWTCPRCGRMFANRNQSHACEHHTVKQHLKGKGSHVRSLYQAFVALVEECGSVSIVPEKTRIGFQARMIFAAVNLRTDGLDAQVVLSRRLENPRFTRIESISPRNHVHHFRILSLEELDDEVAGWLKEAYQVGEQKHLSE